MIGVQKFTIFLDARRLLAWLSLRSGVSVLRSASSHKRRRWQPTTFMTTTIVSSGSDGLSKNREEWVTRMKNALWRGIAI